MPPLQFAAVIGDLPQAVTESHLPSAPTTRTKRTKRLPSDFWPTATLCALAMLLALVATWKGPGLSNDSVTYLSAGVNIAGSHGMTRLDERVLTVFPPGVPVIAAAGEKVGLGVQSAARLLSVVSFGAMVALGNVLLRRVLRDRRAVLASTALLALSPALLAVFDMAWSEPPFIVVSLAFLLVLCRVWERRAVNGVDLVSLAVLCWLGFLFRYVGVSLMIVGAVTLLLALRPLNRRALGQIFVFVALAVSVPILWMLRNHAADGTYLGPRSPSPDSLWDVTRWTAAVIGKWIMVWPDMSEGAFALVGLAAVVLISVAVARMEWPHEGPAAAALACCCIFIPIYVGWLTISALTTAINPTSSRFLSPIFVPLVVVGSCAATRLVGRSDRVLWRKVLVGVVAVGLIGFTFVSVRDARDAAADGIGLNADAVVKGDLAAAAARTVAASPEAVIYSNNPNALWSATGMQPIYFAPQDRGKRGHKVEGQLEAFAEQVACTSIPTYLAFYLVTDDSVGAGLSRSDRYLSLREIRQAVDVRQVAATGDGALLQVSAKPGATCTAEGGHPVREP